MSEAEQICALGDDLDRLIERYKAEFEMTAASVVGVLEFKKFTIMREVER